MPLKYKSNTKYKKYKIQKIQSHCKARCSLLILRSWQMTGFHNGPARRVEKLPLSKLFYPIPVTQSTYLPNKLPVFYLYLPPFANCSKQYFSLSTNSTPFNPQSGPREPQWKPYDLLLFLTPLPPSLPPR